MPWSDGSLASIELYPGKPALMLWITNANIITLDASQPAVRALLIDRGRVIAIGEGADHLAANLLDVEKLDAGGRTILPGLTDAHIHLELYALGLQKINCETDTKAECLQRVAERTAGSAPGEWILGHGWNQNVWADGFGNLTDLDQIAPHNPVYLTAKSVHAAWANSAALRLANLTDTSPDPDGGSLGRDAQGRLTGILFENAMGLVERTIPEPQIDHVEAAIREAMPVFWRFGLTGVHDFDRRRCFMALQNLRQQGELKLRVIKSVPIDELPHAVALGLQSGFGDEFLTIGSVKGFADGALGPQTAAMLAPYENSPQNRGMLLLDAEELFERGRPAVENGLSLAIHAIGDRANHEVLKAYAQLRAVEASLPGYQPERRLRHRIEHVQVIHPQDIRRLAELGVIASMQPIHATSDMLIADRYWGSRAALSYAWRTQQGAGATLAFGSDAPVESPNPFWGLHAAVTRRRLDGSPGVDGWYPEQRLTLLEALHGFTTGPAYAAGREDRQGRLAAGYFADLLVLDEDPFTIPPEALAELAPVGTLLGGEWVYRDFE
ncbi:MAG TPA: amidohydrolase [Anaerolineales bacterium]|nr:amidohydrolase [Anaerolineales bacterium]